MANFTSGAKRGPSLKYTDEYLNKVALTDVPTANASASQQYAGVRQKGLTDYYKAQATGADAGTIGLQDVVAVPASLQAVRTAQNANATGNQNASGGGGGGGNAYAGYQAQLNSLYDQIMNRKPFRYDLNGDLLYRQMADQYTQLGQQAMRDTMGQAAALTGGYGNSYAQQVGNQAYQQYLTYLNEQIPSLYDRAYGVWQDEGDRLLEMYQLAAAHPGYLAAMQPSTGGGASEEETEAADNSYSAALAAFLLGGNSAGRAVANTPVATATPVTSNGAVTTTTSPTGVTYNPALNPLSALYYRNR